MRTIHYFLSIIGALPVTNAFFYTVKSNTLTCNGDPFTEKILNHQCIEEEFYGQTEFYGPKCYWGDYLFFTGSLIAKTSFPTTGQVVSIPEYANWQRTSMDDMQVIGRVCEVIVPLEGQTCGDAGGYGINIEMRLPEKTVHWYTSVLDSITSITIHFENTYTCEREISHNMTLPNEATGIGMGVMFGAVFAIWNGKRRRRLLEQQRQQQNEDDGDDHSDNSSEDDEEMDRYVEMSEHPSPRTPSTPRGADPIVQWRRSDHVVDAMEQHKSIYGDDNMDQYYR